MSNTKIFTVFDSKAEAYLEPFTQPAIGSAVRMFESAANDPEHSFGKYPGDYGLFCIGEFDPKTGRVIAHQNPENLGLAQDYKRTDSPLTRINPVAEYNKTRDAKEAI